MNIIKYSLGYIYPSGLRFLGLIIYTILMLLILLVKDNFNVFLENVLLSKLSLICVFLNICIITYKKEIHFCTENKKIKKWYSILGIPFGEWRKIPNYEYIYLSRRSHSAKLMSYKTGSSSSISYSICYLYGVKEGKNNHHLIFKDYFNKPCLEIALILRKFCNECPVKDYTGREEVEY